MNSRQSYRWPIFLFILVALFLVFEMAIQVSPSVMIEYLMRDLNINALGLGLMSGVYFYTYTLMQIPAGLFFDRFHVRRVIIIPLLFCILGACVFSMADTLLLGAIGRLMMGAGSAFAFIAVLVVAGDLFPAKYFALLAGITQLLAAIGAMAGESPLIPLIDLLGWRQTMLVLAVVGFILAIAIWVFVRYKKTYQQAESHSVGKSLRAIASNPQSWWIAVYACLLWAPMAMFASLWGVPYLVKAHNLAHGTAATILSLMWIGIGVASPLLGWWSDRIGQRRLPLLLATLVGFIATALMLWVPDLPVVALGGLLFLAGAACSGQVLTFAVVRENNVKSNHAAAIGFNNMAVVISGAIFQPLVGEIIHLHWNGVYQNSLPFYIGVDYQAGLTALPFCFAAAFIFSLFFIKETYCRRKS